MSLNSSLVQIWSRVRPEEHLAFTPPLSTTYRNPPPRSVSVFASSFSTPTCRTFTHSDLWDLDLSRDDSRRIFNNLTSPEPLRFLPVSRYHPEDPPYSALSLNALAVSILARRSLDLCCYVLNPLKSILVLVTSVYFPTNKSTTSISDHSDTHQHNQHHLFGVSSLRCAKELFTRQVLLPTSPSPPWLRDVSLDRSFFSTSLYVPLFNLRTHPTSSSLFSRRIGVGNTSGSLQGQSLIFHLMDMGSISLIGSHFNPSNFKRDSLSLNGHGPLFFVISQLSVCRIDLKYDTTWL